MANEINATVLDPLANSYVTLAQATDYMTNRRLWGAGWNALDPDTIQAPALIWASTILDRMMDWAGAKASFRQGMRWPRYGAMNPDGYFFDATIIPAPLIEGVCDLAYTLTQRDTTKIPSLLGNGFSMVKLGQIEVQVDAKMVLSLIPPSVLDNTLNMLCGAGLGTLSDTYLMSGGGRVVSLLRS